MNYQPNAPIYYLSFQLEESEFFLYIEKHAINIKETYKKYEYVRNIIFENLEPEIYTLSKGQNANEIVQSFIINTPDKSINVFKQIKGHINELSKNNHGTYVVQLLIENIQEEYIPQISEELKGHTHELINNKNGYRVLQRLIPRQSKEENDRIYEDLKENLVYFAKDKYGSFVVQEIVKKCSESNYSEIVQKIWENLEDFISDEFGNYIITLILKDKKIKDKINLDKLYPLIKGHIFDFSMSKNTSRIIEKALELGNEIQRKNIINEILELDKVKKDCLTTLSKNKYGNYIVQLLLKFSDNISRENMIQKILSDPNAGKGNGSFVLYYIKKIKNE